MPCYILLYEIVPCINDKQELCQGIKSVKKDIKDFLGAKTIVNKGY